MRSLRAWTFGCLWCCLVVGGLASSPARSAETPNVVVIMADELGWRSVGCYGAASAVVRTPHVDRLAREGRWFNNANTTSSVCSPTRYTLVTGRYCWRTSLHIELLGTVAPLHLEPGRPFFLCLTPVAVTAAM